MKKQSGFTLIEIAIVLVIIGLLLGGVLKGQELINAARVRNLASQLDGVKIAYLSFQDRYRTLPGDMPTATANAILPQINGANTLGCGVAGTSGCNNGTIDPIESALVWTQLAASGFITGNYNGVEGSGSAAPTPTPSTAPTNPFGGYLQLVSDADYMDPGTATAHTNIKTGANVPVSIMYELDTKIDDGLPVTGQFRESTGLWDGTVDTPGCAAGTTAASTYAANLGTQNCGGVSLQ